MNEPFACTSPRLFSAFFVKIKNCSRLLALSLLGVAGCGGFSPAPPVATGPISQTKPKTVHAPPAVSHAPTALNLAAQAQQAQAAADLSRRRAQEAAETQRQQQLAQQRQQAQQLLQQAAAEYEFAAQQWNAELAACQPAQAPGYTAHQRGRFAAMGVGMQVQPQRQPNQMLLERARLAEQRFLQVQQQYQQLLSTN